MTELRREAKGRHSGTGAIHRDEDVHWGVFSARRHGFFIAARTFMQARCVRIKSADAARLRTERRAPI